MLFPDRRAAGRQLGALLAARPPQPRPVVLALPRGGVPVAAEVAAALGAPLDVLVVRKLGVPGRPELAMGAVAAGGVRLVFDDVVRRLGVPSEQVEQVVADELAELARREQAYRGQRPLQPITGRAVLLVDDGLATGASVAAAVSAVRTLSPARVVVAVPVGSREGCALVGEVADEVVCPHRPVPFWAVGRWYVDFTQTTDDEVRRLLAAPS